MKKKNRRLGDITGDSLDQELRHIEARARAASGCIATLRVLEEAAGFSARTETVGGGEYYSHYESKVESLKDRLRDSVRSSCCIRPSTPAKFRAGKKK